GRGDDASLVVLVAGEDQLDQYLMDNPGDFFEKPPERAVVDPENGAILPDHVRSAARENWLSPGDEQYFGGQFPDLVGALEAAGDLQRRETDGGVRWTYDGGGSPQHEMSLRTTSDREIDLFDRRRDERVGSLPFEDALRDVHPGAVYHHAGRTYEVTDIDLQRDRAELDPARVDYYTRVLHDKTVTVERDLDERAVPNADATARFADLSVRKRITAFERRDAKTGEVLGREPLDLPETTLRTRGLYFTVPAAVERRVRERARAGDRGPASVFGGAIHAAEHALIALFPLHVLCDRRDVGGLSTPHHRHTDASTVFVYDGHPGGVGLAREGFDRLVELAGQARDLIDDCDCEDGCPACVQSPHCGNGNDPLDKGGAVAVLEDVLLGEG
ncbi:MAG: Zn-binding domain-containing protein, partial [Halobacteriales archaeon]